MELWGGIECTLNHVGAQRFDQLERSGHYARGDDLERIAALGIRTLRFPFLWERACAQGADPDWRFADQRLAQLKSLGLTPVAGLMHHGSGPAHAPVVSDAFAPGLAAYAGALARRAPWLEWWTPVNEPLTTARFAGLYGHWQPHGRSAAAFARFLLNQCRATVLAMRAVREVNPAARLVQTEDLGTIYAVPALERQAQFENERRWLTWDLLCGRVDHAHPLYEYLRTAGIAAAELSWLRDNPCPPAIIGIDHYVTSDRFLDDELGRYPACVHGGNGRQRYADVEAVRVRTQPGTSLREVIVAAARRHALPVVLTEVHLGCTEDEQVRWLREAWTSCVALAAQGVDVRAATAWALFGSFDWDTLLTRGGTTYESGAFCLRGGAPRLTALGRFIQSLADERTRAAACDAIEGQGWWRRPDRLLYDAVASDRAASCVFPLPVAAGQNAGR